MIRFHVDHYTWEEIVALRGAIGAARTYLACKAHGCDPTCAKCLYFRPCHDLLKFVKCLSDISAAPEEVQK